MWSVKMEYFSFHMFDDETETVEKFGKYIITTKCYESRLKMLSQETTLVLSNTRELNEELFTK